METQITRYGYADSYNGGLCLNGHVVFWAGDPYYEIPEGVPCACGQTIVHWETCPVCGTRIMAMMPK